MWDPGGGFHAQHSVVAFRCPYIVCVPRPDFPKSPGESNSGQPLMSRAVNAPFLSLGRARPDPSSCFGAPSVFCPLPRQCEEGAIRCPAPEPSPS